MSKIYTIEQLNGYIERLFAEEEVIHDISVQGEISGFSVSGKNAFFVLKDENCILPCVFFDYKASTQYLPKNGETAIVKGTPQYSKKYGVLRFSAALIKPSGKGEMYERFLVLREKLRAEGLFDPLRKRQVPLNPRRIAVITSAEGAVIHDIAVTVRGRNPFTDIVVCPVRVQGQNAGGEIAAALYGLNKSGLDLGAVIIARGGGSAEDLDAFNSESIARAVAASALPVVSAVGHETDITLCDMAADLRAATPTAAAAAVTTDVFKGIAQVKSAAKAAARVFAGFFSAKYSSLLASGKRMNAAAGNSLKSKYNIVTGSASKIKLLAGAFFSNKLNALTQSKIRLEKSNPLKLLESGYAKLFKGGAVYSVSQLEAGDDLDVYLKDGIVYTKVKQIKETGTDK